jgi:hypothetical protein
VQGRAAGLLTAARSALFRGGGGEGAQAGVDEPGGTVDFGGDQVVEPGGRGVQVLAQALGLDAPQPEQGPGGDLRLRVFRAHPGPHGQDLGGHEHTGFTGAGGFLLAKLLGSVRRKMLTVGLPAVLDDLDENGALRGSGTRRP